MDPITIGLLVAVGAGGAAAVARWRKRRAGQEQPRAARAEARKEGELRVGDVLTYLGDEFWLAGELSLIREGTPVVRLFSAPERGKARWVGLPKGEDSLFVMEEDEELRSMGWPGVEVPVRNALLKAREQGPCAVGPSGEVPSSWEGVGRYVVLRGGDTVAVVLEQGTQRLAVVGRVLPRRLVERMG